MVCEELTENEMKDTDSESSILSSMTVLEVQSFFTSLLSPARFRNLGFRGTKKMNKDGKP